MVIHDKIEVWTNRLPAVKLPDNWAWVSYFYQLCPRVKYGLGCNVSWWQIFWVKRARFNPYGKSTEK